MVKRGLLLACIVISVSLVLLALGSAVMPSDKSPWVREVSKNIVKAPEESRIVERPEIPEGDEIRFLDRKYSNHDGIITSTKPRISCAWKPDKEDDGLKTCEALFILESQTPFVLSEPEISLDFADPGSVKNLRYFYSDASEPRTSRIYEKVLTQKPLALTSRQDTRPSFRTKILEQESLRFEDFVPIEEVRGFHSTEDFAVKVVFDMPKHSSNQFDFHIEDPGVQTTIDPDISACGTLSEPDGIYTLDQDLLSNGTCIEITGENITLDCQGHEIVYNSFNTQDVGISIEGADDAAVKDCHITGQNEASFGYAIHLFNTSGSTIEHNTITTNGINGFGIYADYFTYDSTFKENDIQTLADGFSPGIVVDLNTNGIMIVQNNIENEGQNSYGIYMQEGAGSVSVAQNLIETSGVFSQGIFIDLDSSASLISENEFVTDGIETGGIYIAQSDGHMVSGNTIHTLGEEGRGIFLEGADDNTISSNYIETRGDTAAGIYAFFGSRENTFSGNDIQTFGEDSYGLFLEDVHENIFNDNTVMTWDDFAYGVLFYQSSAGNLFQDDSIQTTGNESAGILFDTFSDSNSFSGISVQTSSPTSPAVHIVNSIHDFTFTESLLDAAGTDVLVSSEVTDGVWNLFDTMFSTVVWEETASGVLNKGWFLDVNVRYENGTAIEKAPVIGWDNSNDFVFNTFTDSQGDIPQQTLLEYSQTGPDEFTRYNDYTISASLPDGSQSVSQEAEMTANRALVFTFPSGPGLNADLNGDGSVNTLDFLQLLAAWGDCSGCIEDISGDGHVGQLDLDILLSLWG